MKIRTRRSHKQKSLDLVAAAVAYAKKAHEGERLKYVEGIYYKHVKAVSRRMRTSEEKVVALLHDVVENRIKRELGKTPDSEVENRRIKEILGEIDQYFENCGHRVPHLMLDIDILTKRVTDANDYNGYIKRMADDAVKRDSYRAIWVNWLISTTIWILNGILL